MGPFLRRLALSAATGVIFVYWSEIVFWARPTSGTSLVEMAPTTVAYAIAAYLFLATISAFRADRAPAVFLAGALFGWFVEGVIVQTMVEDLPLSISFTGLAWHASITVMLGWWLVPRWLAGGSRRHRSLAVLAAGLGVAYGLWAMTWWTEVPPPTHPLAFAAYAARTTLVLGVAYAVAGRLSREPFRPSRLEWILVAGLILAYLGFVTVPSAPLSLLVLPPLAALALVGLYRLRRRGDGEAPRPAAIPLARMTDYGPLLLLPLTATLVYSLGWVMDARLPTGIALYLVATPLGFVLLSWSLWRAFSRRPAEVTGGA